MTTTNNNEVFETTSISNSSGTQELYHTNLLRLQVKQLLSESILALSSQTGLLDDEVKWTKDVHDYIEIVQNTIRSMGGTTLSPDDVLLKKTNNTTNTDDNDKNKEQSFLIQLHSDKAMKHIHHHNNDNNTSNKSNKRQQHNEWKFTFPGGKSLQMSSANSYAANGAGLTTTVANANVIPTVDLAVMMPVVNRKDNDDDDDDEEGKEKDGMIGGKDYLNGRYFDKRNILAIHIAKFLSQKKQRKQIGSVHIMNELDGDFRKVSLLLTPPLPDDHKHSSTENPKKKQKNKDGQNKNNESQTKMNKKKKIRFRLRLIFGVQYDPSLRNSVEGNTGWIPSARLFPDRCNNKIINLPPSTSSKHNNNDCISTIKSNNTGTPTYNNALASDMHHMNTTLILQNVSSSALKPFTETWTLLKIWCLQRGFLRGHDTLSEKTLGLTLAYLYRSKLVSSRMDSVQVFTVWMKFISDKDWLGDDDGHNKKKSDVNKDTIRHSSNQGYQDLDLSSTPGKKTRVAIVMPEINMTENNTILNCVQNRLHASDMKNHKDTDDAKFKPKSLLESFKVNTDSPIFLDPTMTENYFANISPNFMRELQIEAKKALQCIHFHGDSSNHRVESFKQLFLEQQRFWKRYDAYVKFDLSDIVFPSNTRSQTKEEDMSFWGDNVQDVGNYEAISRGLLKVLKMALGDRITALGILTTGNGETSNIMRDVSSNTGATPIINSDQVMCAPIRSVSESTFSAFQLNSIKSPVANGACPNKVITIGLRINADTCHRLVDRGPPADDIVATPAFVALWGPRTAQLRRFKDGAIVHAVVWNNVEHEIKKGRVQFEGGIKTGDIVERIVRHIFRKHFCSHNVQTLPCPHFLLRNMTSLVEYAQEDGNQANPNASEQAHKKIISAFDSLTTFLRTNSEVLNTPSGEKVSRLGLPLCIDVVEAISPCLRYSEVFPPIQHPSLGSHSGDASSGKKVAGAIVGDPILIQIRFQGSAKWPQDLNAMGAAKCAMLTQLAEGIEKMKSNGDKSSALFDGPINVMPTYLDIGYNGYNFRIIVRADEELKILQSLRNPSQEALTMKKVIRKRNLLSAKHHFTIHGVHTKYASSAPVVRLLKRWLAAHMLSDMIAGEAIELLVASVYTDPAPFHTPSTISCGFLRCLQLLATHDWSKDPLIVDPEGHIDFDDRTNIMTAFEYARGPENKNGPPMFIISPNDFNEDDGTWKPSFTSHNPERVILTRICALAKRSYDFLMSNCMKASEPSVAVQRGDQSNCWVAIFQESSNSLKSYSCLLRVDPELVIDSESGSTGGDWTMNVVSDKIVTPFQRSMEKRSMGPKQLRKKRYKNLMSAENSVIYSWNPVNETISRLRLELGHLALFFYNEYSPSIIGCLWRPDTFKGQVFSAMYSEYKRPIMDKEWVENSLVVTNASDVMRSIHFIVRNVVVDLKILDDRRIKSEVQALDEVYGSSTAAIGSKQKRARDDEDETSSSSDEENE